MIGMTDCPDGKGEENEKETERQLKINWKAIERQL